MRKRSYLLTTRGLGLIVMVLAVSAMAPRLDAAPGQDQSKDQLSVKTDSGGLDVANNANAKEVGLPVYPGATHVRDSDKDGGGLLFNLSRAGKPDVKFVVAKFETSDSIDQVRDFYKKKLGHKVTKFSVDAGDGGLSFEMRADKQHAKFVALKSTGGRTEIDLVRLEGFDISDTSVN